MSKYIHKSHNVSVLIVLFVIPTKYRKVVFSSNVEKELKDKCMEIEKRNEIKLLEMGVNRDYVHLLIQSIPTYSAKKITQMIKSITEREIFKDGQRLNKNYGEDNSGVVVIMSVQQNNMEKKIQY